MADAFEDADFGDDDVADGDELSLPRATVNKIINDMLPNNIQCAKETRDLLINCCVEFIHLIASEANDICEKESRKMINPEHVLVALKTLGFETYIDEVAKAHEEHRQEQQQIRSHSKRTANASGLSAEELKRQQEELFKAARQRLENGQTPQPQITPTPFAFSGPAAVSPSSATTTAPPMPATED